MESLRLAVLCCTVNAVLGILECKDWRGRPVEDGEEYSPNKDDECHKCLCNKGFPTQCKAVACGQPPMCQNLRTVPGECCKFECLDKQEPGLLPNFTAGITPSNDNNVEVTSTEPMTDLGLRLVASTVTTFLILALLLFLIHRLRQRRLLLTLRRYRRRDNFDDSDNISYSPDYFVPCPPYEDPPPPYSPPKPPHIHSGEDPPPYEAIVQNPDNQNNNNNSNNTPPTGSPLHCDHSYNVMPANVPSDLARGQTHVHIRSAGVQTGDLNYISMNPGVQGRSVHSEGVSDVVSSSGLSERATSVTDVEMSSNINSADNSPSVVQEPSGQFSAEPVEREVISVVDTVSVNSEAGSDSLSADADLTVRQFLDRQFGPLGRSRRFVPTMSQSWTSAQFSAVMPEFRQSASTGCFNTNSVQGNSARESRDNEGETQVKKSEVAKIWSRPHTLPAHKATRISYREPDELAIMSSSAYSNEISQTDNGAVANNVVDDAETNFSFNSCSVEANSVYTTRGETSTSNTVGAARRQDALRELRLSHLLNSPPSSFDSPVSPTFPSNIGGPFPLQRSQSILSDNSMFSVCSETGEKRNGNRNSGMALSNDAQYPENSYRSYLRNTLGSRAVEEQQQSHFDRSDGRKRDVAVETVPGMHQDSAIAGQGKVDDVRNPFSIASSSDKIVPNASTDQTYFQSYGTMHQSYPPPPSSQVGQIVDIMTGLTWPSQNRTKNTCSANKTEEGLPVKDSEVLETNFSTIKTPNAVRRLAALDNVTSSNLVPTHDMRAYASQYYACEQEDRSNKKGRGRNIQKRHSASCFPVHKSQTGVSSKVPHMGQKRSPKIKRVSSKSKDRTYRGGEFSEGNQRSSASQENSTYTQTVPNSKVVKHRGVRSERKEYGFIDEPRDTHTDTVKQMNSSHSSPKKYFQSLSMSQNCNSSKVNNRAKLHASIRHPLEHTSAPTCHGNNDIVQKRSRSDCNGNQVTGSPSSTMSSGKKSHGRKKRHRQSFPGTSAFHKELENVLAHKQKPETFIDLKTVEGQRPGSHRDIIQCAVTDV